MPAGTGAIASVAIEGANSCSERVPQGHKRRCADCDDVRTECYGFSGIGTRYYGQRKFITLTAGTDIQATLTAPHLTAIAVFGA